MKACTYISLPKFYYSHVVREGRFLGKFWYDFGLCTKTSERTKLRFRIWKVLSMSSNIH